MTISSASISDTYISLPETHAWQALQQHLKIARRWHLRDLFAQMPARFSAFSSEAAGILFDYSKNRIDQTTLQLLLQLAHERGVAEMRDALFKGVAINCTEQHAALHTALRVPLSAPLSMPINKASSVAYPGVNATVLSQVYANLEHMRTYSNRVRAAEAMGYRGDAFTDIVHIGIGGSHLGPKMVWRALRQYVANPKISFHFVSNADGHEIAALLAQLKPETTLFIVASKSFTTTETLLNAQTARAWFLEKAPLSASAADCVGWAKHFVAITAKPDAARAFGIAAENIFPMQEWVGGRYSIWSAVGLSTMIAIGYEAFQKFLAGAHAMDQHFLDAPFTHNLPVLLALIGIWNRNFLGIDSISIAPYHQDLHYLPAYLQQLEMESNGKHVDMGGRPVRYATAPVIWGEAGTNGQHAYFQLLHQGTDLIATDFIAVARPHHSLLEQHRLLLANCLAHAHTLMMGRTLAETKLALRAQHASATHIRTLAPHQVFAGNRPSNILALAELTPFSLGSLLALYEHKTFVQGVIWGVNSFDQWGVELGKSAANNIVDALRLNIAPDVTSTDSSTLGLMAYLKKENPALSG